jgi:hypothetical protein
MAKKQIKKIKVEMNNNQIENAEEYINFAPA